MKRSVIKSIGHFSLVSRGNGVNYPGTGSSSSAPLSQQRQSFFMINLLCPFMINHQAFSFQQDAQPGIPKPLPLFRQLMKAVTEDLIIARFRLVTVDR